MCVHVAVVKSVFVAFFKAYEIMPLVMGVGDFSHKLVKYLRPLRQQGVGLDRRILRW